MCSTKRGYKMSINHLLVHQKFNEKWGNIISASRTSWDCLQGIYDLAKVHYLQ